MDRMSGETPRITKSRRRCRRSQIVQVSSLLVLAAALLVSFYFKPAIFGYKAYIVMSESMKPVLQIDDLIVIKKGGFSELVEGDIVSVVDYNGNVVTHYFVRYEKDGDSEYVRTKPRVDSDGELTDQLDFWKIDEANYIGKFKFKIKNAAQFIYFLHSWQGLLVLTLLLGLGIIWRFASISLEE